MDELFGPLYSPSFGLHFFSFQISNLRSGMITPRSSVATLYPTLRQPCPFSSRSSTRQLSSPSRRFRLLLPSLSSQPRLWRAAPTRPHLALLACSTPALT